MRWERAEVVRRAKGPEQYRGESIRNSLSRVKARVIVNSRAMIAQDRYTSAMAAAAAVDATGGVDPRLFLSSSSPSRCPPRVHRVKAIGGRRHRAFRSRHVPMLFDSPLVLPYHWPSRGNERESGSALRSSVKLSDPVGRTFWSGLRGYLPRFMDEISA